MGGHDKGRVTFSEKLKEFKSLGVARWIMLLFSLITLVSGSVKLYKNLSSFIEALKLSYSSITTDLQYIQYKSRVSVDTITPIFWALISIAIGILGIIALKSLTTAKVLHVIVTVQFILYFGEMILMTSLLGILRIYIEQSVFYAVFIVVVFFVKKRLRRDMQTDDEEHGGRGITGKRFRDIDDIIMWSVSGLFVIFSVLVIFISSRISANSTFEECINNAYNVCNTVAAFVGEDVFDNDWDGTDTDKAKELQSVLSKYCQTMAVDAIHLLVPDGQDGGASLRFSAYSDIRLRMLDMENFFIRPDAEEYQRSYRLIKRAGLTYDTIEHENGDYPYISQLYAVRDDDENLIGIVCVEVLSARLKLTNKFYQYSIGMTAAILIIITVLVSSRFLNRDIAKPLRKISHEAKRFANSKEDIHVGESLNEIVSHVNEIDRLNSSIIEMEKDTIKYMDGLAHATKERERINTELSLATSIQADSLPNVFPAFPDRKDFDIHASMRPAKEVGGDFYDFFLIDDDHIALVMADVSGKGVPAALFMMITKLLIDVQADGKLSPGEVLSLVSDRISKNNKEDMFVTVWLGILEFSTGKLVSTNAGHEDPIIYTPGEGFKLEKEKHGVPVGIMEGYPFQNLERTIPHGSKIFLYTDGVPEAVNLSDEMFGVERLEEVLNASADKKPSEITTAVVAAVDEFAGEAVQFDDITTLCFEWF